MSTTYPRKMTARDTIAVTLHVALEHHDRSELQEAAALYREILGIDPDHADSLFLLGTIASADGDEETALRLLRAAVRNRPTAAHMHHALAEVLMKANRTAAALHCYWRILALEPENPMAYVQVGDTLRALKPKGGNDPLAISCYQRALMIDQRCALAHFGLGEIYRNTGDTVRAKAAYQAAIAVDGNRSSFHAALAAALYSSREYAWSADAYRRAIQLKPQSPELLRRLGDALTHLGQTERADACYLRANALQAGRIRAARASEGMEASANNLRLWSHRPGVRSQSTRFPQDHEGDSSEGRLPHLAAMGQACANDLSAEKSA